MKILVKGLSPEVQSAKGWIVYVMSETDQMIEAYICKIDELVKTITNFELKYKI
jgi:hypothetical protein